jgi:hypothetical protein
MGSPQFSEFGLATRQFPIFGTDEEKFEEENPRELLNEISAAWQCELYFDDRFCSDKGDEMWAPFEFARESRVYAYDRDMYMWQLIAQYADHFEVDPQQIKERVAVLEDSENEAVDYVFAREWGNGVDLAEEMAERLGGPRVVF